MTQPASIFLISRGFPLLSKACITESIKVHIEDLLYLHDNSLIPLLKTPINKLNQQMDKESELILKQSFDGISHKVDPYVGFSIDEAQ